MLKSSRDKNEGAYLSGDERRRARHMTPDPSTTGRERGSYYCIL